MDPTPQEPERPSDVGGPRRTAIRWQGFFHKSHEALFLLNRQRRLVFVNRSWERLTGLPLSQVRGLSCRRSDRSAADEPGEIVKNLLTPPREVLEGAPGRACRLSSLPIAADKDADHKRSGDVRRRTALRWYQLAFFPLADESGLLGILGKIVPAAETGFFASQPLPENVISLRDQLAQEFSLDRLPAELPAMRLLAEQVRLAGQTILPVTLMGEPGAGKHWLARCIHGLSSRRDSAFACLDCPRLPYSALADVLFGDGGLGRRLRLGTLYLRQPDFLPREMQDRLAQMIAGGQEATGATGPRLIAGFASDPAKEVTAGKLLPEFLCRLSPLVIHLPPLRERRRDLGRLVEMFLSRASLISERRHLTLSSAAMKLIEEHSWPGNLRELYQVLVQASLRAKGAALEAGDLPFHLRPAPAPPTRKLPLDSLLEQIERRLIVLALRQAKNNKTEAAEILAIWRQRLLRRLEALGIES